MPDGYAIIHAVVGAYIKFAEGSGAAASLLFESDVTRDPTVRDRVDAPNRRNAELIAQALVTITDLTPEQALTVARTSTAMAQVAASDAHQGTADLVAQFAWRGIHGMLRREDPPGPATAL